MSIKNQAILVVVIIILCLSGFFLYYGYSQISENIQWKIDNEQHSLSKITDCIIRTTCDSYRPRIKIFIEENPLLMNAIASHDTKALERIVPGIFAKLKLENPYFMALNFYYPDGRLMYAPPKSDTKDGESITDEIHYAVKRKRQMAGFETDCASIFYRIIHPVKNQGNGYSGAVEIKIKLKQIIDLLKHKFNVDAIVYFESGNCKVKASGLADGYANATRAFGRYSLINYGSPLFSMLPSDIDFDHLHQQRTIDKQQYSIHRLPILKDARGRVIGGILTFQNITDATQKKLSFFITSSLAAAVVVFIALGVLWISFNKLVGNLEEYRHKLEETVEELEKTRTSLEEQVEQRTFEISVANASLNREIAERTQAEGEMRKIRRRLELILNSVGEGIFGLDDEGKVTFVNNAAASMLGWKPDEMIGKSHHELVHHHKADGSPYPEESCPISSAYKDGLVHKGRDEVFWTRDTTAIPVEYISTPIVENGKLVGAVVVFRDISGLIEAEERRKQLQKQMELILNSAGEGIFGLDQHGRVTFVNQAALLMLGWRKEDLIGRSHHELIHHHRADGTPFPEDECPIYMAYRDGKVHFSSDDIFWCKDGTSFHVEYVSTPIKEEGRLLGAVVVFRDKSLAPYFVGDKEKELGEKENG